MTEFVRNMAIEQRKRLVAGVMDHFEKKVAPAIPLNVRNQVAKDFREKVMSAVGQYHDVVLDMLKSSVVDGTVMNEEVLELIRAIHTGQQRLLTDVVRPLDEAS